MHKEISREDVNKLEIFRYEGNIELIDNPEDAAQAAAVMMRAKIIGLDTETRPAFKKGQRFRPSLLQMAIDDRVFIFLLKRSGIPKKLCDVFESREIIKAGVAIDNDLEELKETVNFTEQSVIELNSYFGNLGFRSLGLRKLAALVLGVRVSKGKQTSNWNAPVLSPAQIRYAATDAWICRELYIASKKIIPPA